MDYKWYFAFMSIGCLFITIAPLQENQWPLIFVGVLIVASSILGYVRKSKAEKMGSKKKGR